MLLPLDRLSLGAVGGKGPRDEADLALYLKQPGSLCLEGLLHFSKPCWV